MIYYTTYVRFCQENSNARSEHMFPVECPAGLIRQKRKGRWVEYFARESKPLLLYYIMLYINNNIMSKVYNDSNIVLYIIWIINNI